MSHQAGASEWSINGRFFSQKTTGVQRYASEIVAAIDTLDDLRPGEATMFIANSAPAPIALNSIELCAVGQSANQIWEQWQLPRSTSKPILNLCNRGIIAAKQQTICIHDTNVFTCPESYSRQFRLFYKALLPFFARRASRLTTVSSYSADELSTRFDIPRERITVLYNGHEHAFRWRAANSDIMRRFRFDRPFVLTIGSQAKHKNIGMLMGLADALDDMGVDLAVAGGSGGIFADDANRKQANVRLLGYVSDDDLAALLSNALCLAFPSLTEGFGLPLVEAMALGCPVISSNSACMPEICGDAALFADPTDPSSWRRQIKTLLDSKSLQGELSSRGRLHVRRFSWRQSAAGYLGLMRSLS
ncbi:glycosyltransferase family 1 protein [Hyphomicrobium sp. 99]|uniref:glycosyltransferase family 4 protein n=1 Tax=Hyphomicrobium sp. 99 TaxID=1163419 RepID=UPI0009E305F4|nr:glycosyltransferase family 1 protein [Hyphomicrobium sp. 99]